MLLGKNLGRMERLLWGLVISTSQVLPDCVDFNRGAHEDTVFVKHELEFGHPSGSHC